MLDEMITENYEYPTHFQKFLETTKQYPNTTKTFLHIILDINHAFSFIRTDEWSEESLVGKC